MTPREELEALEELARLENVEPPLGKDIARGAYQGVKKGVAAVVGLPADAINLVTQSLPKLVGGAPFFPPMGGTSRDVEGLASKGEAALLGGTSVPGPETRTGRLVSAGTSGLVATPGSVPFRLLGAGGQVAGQVAREVAPEQEWLAQSLAVAPFAGHAAWQALRGRQAERTAAHIMGTVTNADRVKSDLLRREFEKYGGKTMVAQTLPEHSGAAGLAGKLATDIDQRSLINALIAQETPLKNMKQTVKQDSTALYNQGNKVRLTRQAERDLQAEVSVLPKSFGIPAGSEALRPINRRQAELAEILAGRPTARELSVHSDILDKQSNVVPGLEALTRVMSGKVRGAAIKASPPIGEADRMVRRARELEEALSNVGLPPVVRMADKNTNNAVRDLAIAGAASATGHKLVAAGIVARTAKAIIANNPERKLAEALADPTLRKLEALAGASRVKDIAPDALAAAIQMQLQNGVSEE